MAITRGEATTMQNEIRKKMTSAIRFANRGQLSSSIAQMDDALAEFNEFCNKMEEIHGLYVNLEKQFLGENITVHFPWQID